MILRKPYALLIKNFTLIHLALMGLMIYIVVKFHAALTFLNNYIDNTAAISLAETYITLGLYVAIFLVIGITFVILCAVVAHFLPFDYGWFGVSIIFIFHIFKNKKILTSIFFILATFINYFYSFIFIIM